MAIQKTNEESKKPNKFDKVLPRKLQDLMDIKSVKQSDLAKLLGKSQSNVSKYISGDTDLNINDLVKIANYFNVSTDYLLGNTVTDSTNEEFLKFCDYIGLEYSNAEKLKELFDYYNENCTPDNVASDEAIKELNLKHEDLKKMSTQNNTISKYMNDERKAIINLLIQSVLDDRIISPFLSCITNSQYIRELEDSIINFIKDPTERNYYIMNVEINSLFIRQDINLLDIIELNLSRIVNSFKKTLYTLTELEICSEIISLSKKFQNIHSDFNFVHLEPITGHDFSQEELKASYKKYKEFVNIERSKTRNEFDMIKKAGGSDNAKEDK